MRFKKKKAKPDFSLQLHSLLRMLKYASVVPHAALTLTTVIGYCLEATPRGSAAAPTFDAVEELRKHLPAIVSALVRFLLHFVIILLLVF